MKNESHASGDQSTSKLGELIKDIKIAMFTTTDPDGSLRSRPMACQEVDFDGDLWFFTHKSSSKVHSIVSDQKVNLAYASPSDNRYVSVTGRAQIIDDRDKEKELWNPAYKAWFPEGLEDPDLVLIRVRVDSAEYWDSPSSTVLHLVGFTKAIMTGEQYQPDQSEHDRLEIRH